MKRYRVAVTIYSEFYIDAKDDTEVQILASRHDWRKTIIGKSIRYEEARNK